MIEDPSAGAHNESVEEQGVQVPHPRLRRGVFGYRSDVVQQLLADRDTMFQAVAERAEAAEGRVAELEALLEEAERELDGGAQELRVAFERAEALRVQLEEAQQEHEAVSGEARTADLRATTAESRARELEHELRAARTAPREDPGSESLRSRVAASAQEVTDLSRQLEEAKLEIASLGRALEASRAEVTSLEDERGRLEASRRAAPQAPAGSDEIERLLKSAEETFGRIVRAGKAQREADLRDAERVRAAVLEDTSRLEAWLDEVTPLISQVRRSVQEAGSRAARLRDHIHESLDPIAEAVTEIGSRLEDVSAKAQQRPESGSISVGSPTGLHVIELHQIEGASASSGSEAGGGKSTPQD